MPFSGNFFRSTRNLNLICNFLMAGIVCLLPTDLSVALLVNKPDKFRMKLYRSYSVVNKVGTLSNIIITQTKMYVCTFEEYLF